MKAEPLQLHTSISCVCVLVYVDKRIMEKMQDTFRSSVWFKNKIHAQERQ